jgi:hypothetical protein
LVGSGPLYGVGTVAAAGACCPPAKVRPSQVGPLPNPVADAPIFATELTFVPRKASNKGSVARATVGALPPKVTAASKEALAKALASITETRLGMVIELSDGCPKNALGPMYVKSIPWANTTEDKAKLFAKAYGPTELTLTGIVAVPVQFALSVTSVLYCRPKDVSGYILTVKVPPPEQVTETTEISWEVARAGDATKADPSKAIITVSVSFLKRLKIDTP